MNNYNAFIFDFDFTLADAAKGIVESANFAVEKLGLQPISSGEIRKTIGMSLKGAFSALTGITDSKQTADFLKYFHQKADEVMTENTALFPDTISTLEKIKARNSITGIVSNKFSFRIRDALEKHGILHLIDYIVGTENVKEPKPSPEGLLKAMDALSCLPERALYIGDSLADAKTAQNAGVDFAAVTTGTTSRKELEIYPNIMITESLDILFGRLFS